MDATIKMRDVEYDDVQQKMTTGFFGRLKFKEINHGKKTAYWVDLFLTPTEEERAVILTFKLDELLIEEEPAFSDEQLAR